MRVVKMPTLDDLREKQEAVLEAYLASLSRRHREMLRDALRTHGSVANIPQSVWDTIEADMRDEQIALLLFLAIFAADQWTTEELERQGVSTTYPAMRDASYDREARRRAREMAARTTRSIRDRLERKVQDAQISGPGEIGELTDRGIDEALDDVFKAKKKPAPTPDDPYAQRETFEHAEGIATDETTGGFSQGQRGAKQRIEGSDGASTTAGQKVTLELYWVTERDDRVCPRCAPLHDKPESVWGRVFPNGPGPEAHPNCRCSLRPVVVVELPQEQGA
jgi:hypothetical protein